METKQMQADPNSNRSKKRAAAEAHNAKMRASAVEGTDMPTAEERAELERLSTKVFSRFNPFTGTFSPGPSSRWQTLLKRGTTELVTEEVTEYVPEEKNEAGEVIKAEEMVKHQQPVKYMGAEKSTISTVKRFTVQSLIAELKEREVKHDEFVAKLEQAKKEQEEKRKQELLAKQVQESVGGSAL